MLTKESLIKDLIKGGYLKTPDIIEAFEKIDRLDFVPEKLKDEAYLNQPLPIGFGQTISQPLTVAFMLELLEPKPGEKILDVGAGSGWVSALLAYIVGEKGNICAFERIPEICEFGKKNVAKYNFIEKGLPVRQAGLPAGRHGIVGFFCGDASKGYSEEAPYDKIIAGAAAEEIPSAWKEELKIGGRLVMPVGHNITVLDKISPSEFEKKEFFGFSFVPLVKDIN
ncbi:MAG: protein-L-isoaspartate O-methyltransferase [Candidatus Marinimicrobia bacterium]|nr:protein-L-isoaspartate O-methyltransferase [Candidatus Neomarinimicrobiota bacterium]